MARFAALALLAALCVGHAGAMYDGEDSPVKMLDAKTFDAEVMESDDAYWLVEFFAPWCGHCKQLAPTYEKVAKNLNGLVKVGAVDCDHKDNAALCSKAGVRGYPTLKIYPVEKSFNPYTKKSAKMPSDYNGPRSAKGMVDMVLGGMPDMVHHVNNNNVTDFLVDEYPKAILFSDKEATSPLFKSLAIQFKGRMRMGKASTSDEALMSRFMVESGPKLVVVPGSDVEKHVKHDGKLKKDELQTFLSTHALKEKKDDPLLAAKTPKQVKAMTGKQLQEEVLEDTKRLWLVFFHTGGKVPAALEQMATSFKAFSFASVDCSAGSVCKDNSVDGKEVLRLYQQDDKSEYEDFTGEATCDEDCMQLEPMSDFVAEHMPNLVVAVGEPTWNNFLAPAAERPRVILLSKKQEPTPLFKSVALKYKDVLTFGLYANPSSQAMAQLQIKKLPQLMVFFSQNGTAESLQGFPYQGGFTYEEMTAVIDQFAAPFMEGFDQGARGGKPGQESSTAASKPPEGPVDEMQKGDKDFDALCGKKGGLCAIAFVDASPANEKKDAELKALEELRKAKHPSPYHFSWVDASCHLELMQSLDIDNTKVPGLVVLSPSKGRFATHVGKFNVQELGSTLDAVLSGRVKTGPYSSLQPLSDRACSEVHAEVAAAIGGGEAEEEDDIMKEMMAEIKAKEAAAAEEEEEASGKKKKKKKKKKGKK